MTRDEESLPGWVRAVGPERVVRLEGVLSGPLLLGGIVVVNVALLLVVLYFYPMDGDHGSFAETFGLAAPLGDPGLFVGAVGALGVAATVAGVLLLTGAGRVEMLDE